jgi:KRAB domain-containing zinc finger protein
VVSALKFVMFSNKAFIINSYLITDRRIHSGERPHVCDVCNKAFSVQIVLTRYLRIHGELPNVCDVCSEALNEKSHLVRHQRIHSGESLSISDVCNVMQPKVTSGNTFTHA